MEGVKHMIESLNEYINSLLGSDFSHSILPMLNVGSILFVGLSHTLPIQNGEATFDYDLCRLSYWINESPKD